jgi:hypothetical protein
MVTAEKGDDPPSRKPPLPREPENSMSTLFHGAVNEESRPKLEFFVK